MAYWVGHLGLNGGVFISLNGWGIYDLMGGAFISLNGWGICHLMGRAFIT